MILENPNIEITSKNIYNAFMEGIKFMRNRG